MGTLETVTDEIRNLQLEGSLLCLNHILCVSRHLTEDEELERKISRLPCRPLPHIVHFLAKQLLLHASNLGTKVLDWPLFLRLMGKCIDLDDPIQHDPNWEHSDPSGFFERVTGQQIPAQQIYPIQRYGLALGLFRDVGIVEWPESYDLRSEIETELGMSVDRFLSMAFLCCALRGANPAYMGTFTSMTLAEAYAQGVRMSVPENWEPFLTRAACDRDEFRRVSESMRVSNPLYAQFEFNALHRFPIAKVQPDHFIAVDPWLIVQRATLGLFYDLFERGGTRFSQRFGYAFDQFVGQLLGSACDSNDLWSASNWECRRVSRSNGKIGDWAFRGRKRTVLLECKSLRPSLELTTYGSDGSILKLTERIIAAVEQLAGHARAIQKGDWEDERLMPGEFILVVVTYGRINTINGPFIRDKVVQHFKSKCQELPPFVVLSIEELDSIVRLIEAGNPLDELLLTLTASDPKFNVLQTFHSQLQGRAASSFSFEKGRAFIERAAERN